MRVIITTLALLFAPSLLFAQNICTGASTLTKNPTKVAVQTLQMTQNAPDGTALVAQAEVTFRKTGDTTVAATVNYPKASFALVQGTTDCYAATLTQPTGLIANQSYTASVRLLSAGGAASPSVTGNPFFWDGAPDAPGSFRIVRAAIEWLKQSAALAAKRFSGVGQTSRPVVGRSSR